MPDKTLQERNYEFEKSDSRKYWLEKLGDVEFKTYFPYDFINDVGTYSESFVESEITGDLFAKMMKLSNGNDLNLLIILLAGLTDLLSLYCLRDDIIIGTSIFKQEKQGDFINTVLAIRNCIPIGLNYKDLLIKIKKSVTEAESHANYSFKRLLHRAYPKDTMENNPLFDCFLLLENIQDKKYIEHIKTGIMFYFFRKEDRISLKLVYNAKMYKRSTIQRIIGNYLNWHARTVENTSILLSDVNALSDDEEKRIYYDFNRTATDIPIESVGTLFEKIAEKYGDGIALTEEDMHLNYRDLNARANQLARILKREGVKANIIAGIIIEPSIETIIAILAVIKAGGAYLPINPMDPMERIRYYIENSGCRILLTSDDTITENGLSAKIININDQKLYSGDDTNLEGKTDCSDLVYVIYTSGTTGSPKGVMVTHENLINYVNWFTGQFEIEKDDKTMLLSSLSFDLCYTNLYSSLLSGCELHLIPRELYLEANALLSYINKNKITYIKTTPSLFSVIVGASRFTEEENLKSVRFLVLGGEAIVPADVEKLNRIFPGIKVINHYGPTETTIGSITYMIDFRMFEKFKEEPVIGRPVNNTEVYILDSKLRAVPIGVQGNMYIGGKGVSRGYMGNSELDRERFIMKKVGNTENRLYKTGDLGMYTEEGNIRFIGRADDQVKIRGYRIELHEIETALLKHESIRESAVKIFERKNNAAQEKQEGIASDKLLCAYFVANEELSSAYLKEYLLKSLPQYMVPSYFVQLENMPLTANKKIDKRALAMPVDTDVQAANMVPFDEIEKKIATYWRDILYVKQVGMNDDFFQMGGHSLNATALVARILKELKVEIPLRDLFAHPTLSGIAKLVKDSAKSNYTSIEPVEKRRYYPLSSAQKRMYVLNQMEPGGVSYNTPYILELEGNLDLERLEAAFNKIAKRHEALRTQFEMIDNVPVQKIIENLKIKIEYKKVKKEDVERHIDEFIRPFDLSKAPLFRAGIINLAENKNILMVDFHHIIVDGVSLGRIFSEEFSRLYAGEEIDDLGEIRIQYKDYAVWQQNEAAGERIKRQLAYWKGVFPDEIPALAFPTDYPRTVLQNFEGAAINFNLPAGFIHQLKDIGKESEATYNMTLLALYKILLYKYTGQEDIVVGIPIANRTHSDLEKIFGMFVNTLAIRTKFTGKDTFVELLNKIKTNTLAAYENQDCQFEDLVEQLHVRRDISRNPLFDTMLILQNMEVRKIKWEGMKVEEYNFEKKETKMDLSLNVIETETGASFNLQYSTKLFRPETIERFKNHFTNLIGEIIKNPNQRISEIDILSGEEKNLLLVDFNKTEESYAGEKTINQLFENQVAKTPDNIALVCQEKKFTYDELNRKANSLGKVLREKGVKPDSIVGIMIDRSPEMIIVILGITKSGGAYLPIDPEYPQKRIEYMLKDSKASILLTQKKFMEKTGNIINSLEIIDAEDTALYAHEVTNLQNVNKKTDLAYVIYTSGSTGEPKGVMIEHKGISNLNLLYKKYFKIDQNDRILQFAILTFDASVSEIIMALTLGGALYIPTKEIINDFDKFQMYIDENEITVVTLPPAYLVNLNPENIRPLKLLITAGSVITKELVNKWNKKFNYINAYGPTETTICASAWISNLSGNQKAIQNSVSIGKPIVNTKIYIIDNNRNLLPIGAVGELCVSGISLARGYLNQLDFTSDRFEENPFEPGTIMYKTGDFARWLPDGNIEFIGRIDQQVKIRGFRIELGEIEEELKKCGEIINCAVIAKEDETGNKYLAVYYTDKNKIKTSEIRLFLSERLPDYMVPGVYIRLNEMPLTSSGKIDRNALPDPSNNGIKNKDLYVSPRNKIEEVLVSVWEQVLGREKIGIDDNYFELGGDSIKAIQINSRLKAAGFTCEMISLFKYPAIRSLSNNITEVVKQVDQKSVIGNVPLIPIQKWFFQEFDCPKHHFNQSAIFGIKSDFNMEALKEACGELLVHHDAMRMTYTCLNGEYKQENLEQIPLDFSVYDLRGKPGNAVESVMEGMQKSFVLETGPLVKFAVLIREDRKFLFIVAHHLIVDGVSWRILLEDLERGYEYAKKRVPISLPLKTNSFKDWALGLYDYSKTDDMGKAMSFFHNQDELARDIVLSGTGSKSNRENIIVEMSISLDETERLLTETFRAYNLQINDILLTALASSLYAWCGIRRILIDIESHGRTGNTDIDISRTVGWFTVLYPVLLDLIGCENLEEKVVSIKEQLRCIPMQGIGYGIAKYLLGEKFESRAQVLFNYLGQFDSGIETGNFSIEKSFSMGNSISPSARREHALVFNAMVVQGQFRMTLTSQEYCKERLTSLLVMFQSELLEIISWCTGKKDKIPTPSDFTMPGLSLDEYKKILNDNHLMQTDIQDIYNLSPMQEGFLFHSLLDPKSPAYFEQMVLHITGNLDMDFFETAWNMVAADHAALRTLFLSNFRIPLQVVLKERKLDFAYEDVRGNEAESGYIEKIKIKDREKGFDLTRDTLLRVMVLRCETEYSVIISFPHIIFDGWCLPILFSGFIQHYDSLLSRKEFESLERVPYARYIEWLNKQDRNGAREYWSEYLSGYSELASVPGDKESSDVKADQLNYVFTLDGDLYEGITQLAKKNEVTLNTVVQTVWGVILSKYNGKNDIVFGSTVSGRSHEIPDVEKILGLFINTVPIRIKIAGTFGQVIREVQKGALESTRHHYYSLAEIQNNSLMKDGLFDHCMVFENYPIDKSIMDSSNLTFNVTGMDVFEQTHYDFGMVVIPSLETMDFRICYHPDKYRLDTIKRIASHIVKTMEIIVADFDVKMEDIDILGGEEKNLLLYKFNPAGSEYQRDNTLVRCFERQAEHTPDNMAAVYEDTCCTYRELNERANLIAHYLKDNYNLETGKFAGIMMNKSNNLIAGIFGILKTGCAYFPIDPEYPRERVKFMLEDAQPAVVLTESAVEYTGELASFQFITMEKILETARDKANPGISVKPEDIAYIIYTSGSTGNPKGTMIEHKSFMNMLSDQIRDFKIVEKDVILQFASISFDVSLFEIALALFTGSTLCIADKIKIMQPESLVKYIEHNKVSVLALTPSYLKQLDRNGLKNIRVLITGGEQPDLEDALFYAKQSKYYNAYGPTETAVCASYYHVQPRQYYNGIPIGKPVSNSQVYIVDDKIKLLPMGIPGELCIAGIGLARGYLNRHELTSEKFVDNPFSPGTKLYRTGDLARWLPDGNLEFLGRVDEQVKVRGYRIETGEIENTLLKYEDIKSAVVTIVPGSGNRDLAAYLVTTKDLDIALIRDFLCRSLPDYMIPAYFVKMESLPLSPNGKVDKKALPDAVAGGIKSNATYIAPRNNVEEILVSIWEEVLGKKCVGILDDFFVLGGDSIKVIRIVGLAVDHNINIAVSEVFKYKTICRIVENVDLYKKNINQYNESEKILNGFEVQSDNNIYSKTFLKKSLRIKIQKEMTCYLHRSLPLCALLAEEKLYSWFYEHFIQLFYPTYLIEYPKLKYIEENTPKLEFLETFDFYETVADVRRYEYKDIQSISNIIEFIIEMINKEFYIIINVDEFYLPGKPNYRKGHFIHQCMIYGYDNQIQQVATIGFNQEGMFTRMNFDYDQVFKAYENGKIYYKDQAYWYESRVIQLIRLKEIETYPFHKDVFLNELYNYIYSVSDDRKIYQLWQPSQLSKYEKKVYQVQCYGIKIHNEIVRNLDRFMDGEILIDYRAFHLLYEHKKGMNDRLKYVLSKENISDDSLYQAVEGYNLLVEQSKLVKNIFFDLEKNFNQAWGNNDPHERLKASLNSIKGIIKEISVKEEALLSKIYHLLVSR